MTFKQMIDEFDMRLGDLISGSMPRLYVKRLLNEAQRDIARKTFCLDSTYTTNSVAGQATYGFSNEFAYGGLRMVAYDGDEMVYKPQVFLSTDQGTPAYYYLLEGTLGLYPIPDAAKEIKVVFHEIPPDMTTDGSVSPIPNEYHDLILSYALTHGFRTKGQEDMAQVYRQQYLEGLSDLKDRNAEDQQHQLHRIESMVRKLF